jgi:hypothetical protein
MPADLDQFGREYSHGTVIGRKRLVELGHVAAYGGRSFDKVNLETGNGKIKRRLNAADPPTHHHDISKITVAKTFAQLLDFVG